MHMSIDILQECELLFSESFYCNTSTYFVNLTSDLHTIISKKSKLTLKIIKTKLKLIFQTTKTKLKYENRF